MIENIPTEWLEQCLAAMALDPATAGDYYLQPVGMPCGRQCPEFGPAVYELACQVCDATWAGVPGDLCWWCERSAQIQIEHQIDLLLTPPDIDEQDATYEARMTAWSGRMVIGIAAGLITEQQSKTAWHRALKRTGAA